jgi:nitroimidazol reductase NimA-like FMN-containing flavoprotein (pyridoxamine 5'-phosphate oxidase superfamily)
VTDRTTLRRKRERGSSQRSTIEAILDEGLIAHVGFVADHGPVVLPMAYARRGDFVYLHGATGNDMLRHLAAGSPLCLTVTLIDGLVLARSAFRHSMNYRSVVVFGTATRVTDPEEVQAAAAALLEHVAPGRSAEARPPSDEEVRSTLVLRVPIDEASAKVRSGGPLDNPEDLDLTVWAGQLPLALQANPPIEDAGNIAAVPGYITNHHLRP